LLPAPQLVAAQPLAAELGTRLQPLSGKLQTWLVQERKLSPAVLARRVSMVDGYRGPSVAFPYYQAGALVNIKYRSLSKQFSQVKGGRQVLYGVDDLQVCDTDSTPLLDCPDGPAHRPSTLHQPDEC
jgi:hypothetical protein